MPKLLHLHIGLQSHDEEQYLIDQLPNLLTINSKRIRFVENPESDRPSEHLSEGQTERS